MDCKKILEYGIVYYAIVYLAASIVMFTFGLEGTLSVIAITVVNMVTIYILANKYFTKKTKQYLKEGLKFGLGVSITAFIIEAIVMVYGVVAEQGWAWYTQNGMLYGIITGYILIILISIFVLRISNKLY